jgi:hypothetical protein
VHTRTAKKAGETGERLATLAAWRDAPYFTEPERAALALTEAATRLADRAGPVPGQIHKPPPDCDERRAARPPRRIHTA